MLPGLLHSGVNVMRPGQVRWSLCFKVPTGALMTSWWKSLCCFLLKWLWWLWGDWATEKHPTFKVALEGHPGHLTQPPPSRHILTWNILTVLMVPDSQCVCLCEDWSNNIGVVSKWWCWTLKWPRSHRWRGNTAHGPRGIWCSWGYEVMWYMCTTSGLLLRNYVVLNAEF